jgi:hypothetical protein
LLRLIRNVKRMGLHMGLENERFESDKWMEDLLVMELEDTVWLAAS